VADPGDPIDELARGSGLLSPSPAAAAAAWAAALASARAAWPTVQLDEAQLATFLGPRLAGADLVAALATAPIVDLAIAAACHAQEPTAHAAFDAILTEVDAAGASTRSPRELIDDVKQVLRVQLLVSRDGKPPGIGGYQGKGPLRGWVRITATRELIRHQKKRAREAPAARPIEELLGAALGAGEGDPMLDQMKVEYRAEFASALREAIIALSAEDRTLLRQQIVDGLSIDALGAAYGVHRATAARWANRARGALVAATRTQLAARLAVPVEEIDSVIRLVQSKLDASVVRYLRESDR
jgi:RNA polymerase sigma-70 factor, ECF subfamily